MDDFFKMDVFFIVSTIAVVVLTALVAYGIYRLIRFIDTLERIAKSAEEAAGEIRKDIEHLRAKAKREGLKLRHIVKFLGGLGSKERD